MSRSAALAVFAFALAASQASAASVFDIEYPIDELGGCKDRLECKAYCEDPANEDACADFASRYGIGGEKREDADERIRQAISDGGPGGCAKGSADPERSCRRHCSVQANMRECISYAKSRGMMEGKELEEAEKVLAALEGGAKLPAGCTDMESCHDTCENPKDVATMRSCFDFAEKAGLLPPDVTREKAEKMFALIESGKAPFKSPKDFEQCEDPANDEILEKCVNFGLESGFIPPEEAEMIRKTGGKGPGGCRGKNECEAYCAEHGEECFKFAEEHDLIGPEEKQRMEEGKAKMKEGLEMAPPEVRTCLEQSLGASQVDKILSGAGVPSREMGEKMRACFESGRGSFGPEEGRGESGSEGGMMGPPGQGGRPGGMQFPPEVRACVEAKLGKPISELERQGEPSGDMGAAIGECFRSVMGAQGAPQGGAGMPPREGTTFDPSAPRPDGAYPRPEEGFQEYPPMRDGAYPPPNTGYPPEGGAYERPPEGAYPQGGYPPPGGSPGTYAPPPAETAPAPAAEPVSRAPRGAENAAGLFSLIMGLFDI